MRITKLLTLAMAIMMLLTGASLAEAQEGIWPEEKLTLTYWVGLNSNAAASMSSYDDHVLYQVMEEKTNMHMDFMHPTAGNATTEFNLLMVSNELPDIIEYNWPTIAGGPQKYIDDGIIIPLNDLLDKYAPDALTAMTQTENIRNMCTTDQNNFYAFTSVISTTWSCPNANTKDPVQCGPVIRADWLEDLGLEAPATIDDWTSVLTAFKDEKGATAPITVAGTAGNFWTTFAGAFDTHHSYYQRDGQVVYGPIEENYKSFLKAMNQWYVEGLLDPDFASNDGNAVRAKMLSGASGAGVGYSSSFLATYINAAIESNPDYDLMAVRYPLTQNGDAPSFMTRAWDVRVDGAAAISTSCEYPEYVAKYMNYFYGEGSMLTNFGVEGVSWNYAEDGSLEYTSLLSNNPDGLSLQQALAKYSRGDTPSPRYVLKTLDLKTKTRSNTRMIETLDIWVKDADNCLKVLIPPTATQTSDESIAINEYSPNINTYATEMMIKFIMGTADIDAEWDAYIEQLNTLGIENVIELKQAALDRYVNR